MRRKMILGVVICSLMLSACGQQKKELTVEDLWKAGEGIGDTAPAFDTNMDITVSDNKEDESYQKSAEQNYIGLLTAPSEYDGLTYGTAPLSSVYLMAGYAILMDDHTLEEMGYNDLTADELIAKLDEDFRITECPEDQKEEERYKQLFVNLIFCGVCDGSDDQIKKFFEGTWIPDGTKYDVTIYLENQ